MSQRWIVFGEHPAPWHQPSEYRRHDSFNDAFAEGCRLALQHPDVRFTVFQEVTTVVGRVRVDVVAGEPAAPGEPF